MIYLGYMGIGKTTLSNNNSNYIDLDSSYYKFSDTKGWPKSYCDLALFYSNQGYNVFLSCYDEVFEYFLKNNIDVIAVYPRAEMYDLWVKKLFNRYINSGLTDDLKSYIRARDYYMDDITSPSKYGIETIYLDENYNLEEVINNQLLLHKKSS